MWKVAQIEGFSAQQFVKWSNYPIHKYIIKRQPQKILTSDKNFKKLHHDMEDIYKFSWKLNLREDMACSTVVEK